MIAPVADMHTETLLDLPQVLIELTAKIGQQPLSAGSSRNSRVSKAAFKGCHPAVLTSWQRSCSLRFKEQTSAQRIGQSLGNNHINKMPHYGRRQPEN